MFSDSQFSPFFPIQLVYIQLIAVAAIKNVLGLLLHSAHPLTSTTGVSFLRKLHWKKIKDFIFGGGGCKKFYCAFPRWRKCPKILNLR